MKYTEAFIALGATYSGLPNQRSAVNQSQKIYAFWDSPDEGKGDRWRVHGSYIQVSRNVGGPWTSTKGGQDFYKSILDDFHTGTLVKVVKYRKAKGSDKPLGGPKAAEPMIYGGKPMLGRVQIEPIDAIIPEQLRKIDILLMPAPGATGGNQTEIELLGELIDRGVPAFVRMIKAKHITIENTEVPWIHSKLTEDLKIRLEKAFPEDSVFVECALFGELSRADVVREEFGTRKLHIYEVKTSTDAAQCERASIGQLLEYYALAKENGRDVGTINTVGMSGSPTWVGRTVLSKLPVLWTYISLNQ